VSAAAVREGAYLTSVDDVVLVKVVDRLHDLTNRLCGVLFGELALLADAIEQLSARRQLCHNVVLVLAAVSRYARIRPAQMLTLDSNQSWNLTMCGCFMRCSISSSS
jgi:hypothetical protein